MIIRTIYLVMVSAVSGYSQVKESVIYKDAMTQMYVYKYDTLGAGTSYTMMGKDLRYEYINTFDLYYKGADIVAFIDKVTTFVNDAEPKTHTYIEGVKVIAYPKHVQLHKDGQLGYRVISKKKLVKIRSKCLQMSQSLTRSLMEK